jgi:hypothetical protein
MMVDSVRAWFSAGIKVGSVSDMGSSFSLCLGLGAGYRPASGPLWYGLGRR